jgi:hypothetical protein
MNGILGKVNTDALLRQEAHPVKKIKAGWCQGSLDELLQKDRDMNGVLRK